MFPVALWDEARRPSVSVLDTHRTSHGTKQQIIWLECTQVLFCPRNLSPEAGKWDSFCGKDKMTHRPWRGVTWYLTRSSISLWNTAFRPEKVWGNPDTHLTMNSFYIYIKAYKTKQRWNATSILNLQKDKTRKEVLLWLNFFRQRIQVRVLVVQQSILIHCAVSF